MFWTRPPTFPHLTNILRKLSTSCRSCSNNLKAEVAPTTLNSVSPAGNIKDVILYKYEAPRFFKYLNFFAISQYGFWMFIGYSSFKMLDIPVPEKKDDEPDLPFWRQINLGADKYKYGLAVGATLMGFGVLSVCWIYTLRTVRYLIFRKDGKTVAFVTYAPFGENRIMNVPIKNISAFGSRSGGTTQMPIKVKGRSLYYLLDLREGKIPQPELFDRTVGTKRKLV